LDQYIGRLSPGQAATGIRAAIINARHLLEDAELLFQKRRWERATALAILAIEEIGKVPILREVLLARDDSELRACWRRYRSHTGKNVHWILPQLIVKGARKLEHLRPAYEESSDHGNLLESIKQLAFYSDALGKCRWWVPGETTDEELFEAILEAARVLVKAGDSAFTSEKELEIWVKHLRPVWKQNMDLMKKALLASYAEAESKGVLRGKSSELTMLNFLYQDPAPLEE
jgi:AbiV family abortive infection protein